MTKIVVLALLDRLNTVRRYRQLSKNGILVGPDQPTYLVDSTKSIVEIIQQEYSGYAPYRYYYVEATPIPDQNAVTVTNIWESVEDGPFEVTNNTRFQRIWIDISQLEEIKDELRNREAAVRGNAAVSQ